MMDQCLGRTYFEMKSNTGGIPNKGNVWLCMLLLDELLFVVITALTVGPLFQNHYSHIILCLSIHPQAMTIMELYVGFAYNIAL